MHANILEYLNACPLLFNTRRSYQAVYVNANVSNFIGALLYLDKISNSNRRFHAIARYLNKTLKNVLNQLLGIEHRQFLRVPQLLAILLPPNEIPLEPCSDNLVTGRVPHG